MARMISQTQLLSNSWHKQLFMVFLRGELKGRIRRMLPSGISLCRSLGSVRFFCRWRLFLFLLDKRVFFAYNEDDFTNDAEVKKWQDRSRENPL